MRTLRKYLRIAGINLQTALMYPANLYSGLLFYVMFISIFFCLWRAIYAGKPQVTFTLTQMVWYLCLTEVVAFSTRGSQLGQIDGDIRSGAIAYQMNRPYHFVAYVFASSMGQMLFNLALFGTAAFFLGLFTVGPLPGFSMLHLPAMVFSLLLGVCLNFFFQLALRLSAFQLEDSTGVCLVYSKMVFMMGTFLPVELLPGFLQRIARFLPFSYVSWAPARLVVAFSWPSFAALVLPQCVWLLVAVGAALGMYRAGARRVSANGG